MVSNIKLRFISSSIIYTSLLLIIFTEIGLYVFIIAISMLFIIWIYKIKKETESDEKVRKVKEKVLEIKEVAEKSEDIKSKEQENAIEALEWVEKYLELMLSKREESYTFLKFKTDLLVKEDKDLIDKDKEIFHEKFNEICDFLFDILDYEEIRLIEFLDLKHKFSFNKFIIFEVFIFIIAFIFGLMTFTFLQFEYYYWFLILLFLFRDTQYISELIFRKGYLRYKVVKKIISNYQLQLRILLNSNLNQKIYKDIDTLRERFSILDQRISYYNIAIPPFYSYIKNIELVGYLGILITILIFIVQGYIYEITPVRINIVDLVFSFIAIYVFLISPTLQKQKEYKEKQLFKTIYSKIDQDLKKLREIQLLFVGHYSKLFEEISQN